MANETFGGPFPAYIASKQSINFTGMTAGVDTIQVTVEGAQPGDGVVVVRPAASVITDELLLSGYCDTADLVDINVVSNVVGATTDLAAVTLTILVFPA